jgi:hypothetical protein
MRSMPRILCSSLFLTTLLTSAAAQDAFTLRPCLTEKNLQLTIAEDATWENATSPWSLGYNPEPAEILQDRFIYELS